ncbi:MAG: SRPBCC domain-containing protein [Bacteroidales bacterium]|nr:SRPBCC domain-containing protein [Bacteroidales bacterium]
MESIEKTVITVWTIVNAPIGIVWKNWTTPDDIIKWNNASDDWHTPRVVNDLRGGGKFSYRMEAKDGSMGFDLWGIYDKVMINSQIDYTLGDGRKVKVIFGDLGGKTEVVETFEAETANPIELQRNGWQAILDNFKKYTETH